MIRRLKEGYEERKVEKIEKMWKQEEEYWKINRKRKRIGVLGE